MPELFPLIRSLVDESERKCHFLLLGSASPDLLKQSSESLAGRIKYHELTRIIHQVSKSAKIYKILPSYSLKLFIFKFKSLQE